ncbi:hypothetical protein WICMUC_005396 [Wickerhamomyces mucosus]|uniref:TFIIS N-terminal domain-containing protein n=1 Tax=Wickerhamomyces mucosus TaxID=1378264 RepID=A0A9P8P9B1_9ASCO|nr:hypothetical protein WICMUC_005396 [Wickerhamomyces mucosus]
MSEEIPQNTENQVSGTTETNGTQQEQPSNNESQHQSDSTKDQDEDEDNHSFDGDEPNVEEDALDLSNEYVDDFSNLKSSKRSNAPKVQHEQTERPSSLPEPTDNTIPNSESYDEATKRRRELEEKLDRALKKPKVRRRKDEHDLTNDEDELIQILKGQMDQAAKKDSDLIANGSGIAINKIQLLPRVRDILSKVNLHEVILDNNLLAEIRQWLEPLPDASLPSYEIQKELFSVLVKLPINTNHLRESGIGKILLFYQKSKRVEPKIKRIADKLVSDWTRPIIGASDNYRDKKFSSIDFDQSKLRSRAKQRANSQKEMEKSIYEQQAARRNRAAAPAPTVTDYKFVPKSRIDRNTTNNIINAGVGSSLNRDDQFKRINSKLSGRRTATKKGGISVEGRGLH